MDHITLFTVFMPEEQERIRVCFKVREEIFQNVEQTGFREHPLVKGVKLRIGGVLLCRFFQPIYRLFGIRLDAAAEPVARTQLKLCLSISGICRLPEQPQRILRIPLDAVTDQVTDTQLASRRDVALFCGFLKPVDRLAVLCL